MLLTNWNLKFKLNPKFQLIISGKFLKRLVVIRGFLSDSSAYLLLVNVDSKGIISIAMNKIDIPDTNNKYCSTSERPV